MKLLLLSLLLAIWGIGSCQQPNPIKSTTIGATLHYNPYLDTITDTNSLIIARTLRQFLLTKNQDARSNIHWLASDFDTYGYPFIDIYEVEEDGKWQATLLDIITIEKDKKYQIKLAYTDTTGAIKMIYNLLAISQPTAANPQRFVFARILQHQTQDWEVQQVGAIKYILSPQHTFDSLQGQLLDSFNNVLADFFETEVLDITYYLCQDPQELFRIRGFDYNPTMFKFENGGQNESWRNIIYAGNNAAWYPHELVHSYTYARYARTIHRVFDEGLATYLGGSNELPLSHHLQNLKRYLAENPTVDALDLLYNNTEIYDKETACLYAIGGLFCQLALERPNGKIVLQQLLEAGKSKEDFLAIIDTVFGIQDAAAIDGFVRKSLH